MAKTIVIIGAGHGLGQSLARKFGQRGDHIVLLARNAAHLADLAADLSREGIQVQTVVADVADEASLNQALTTLQQLPTLDGVIYNAGITAPDSPALSRQELTHHFQVDVAGAYQTAATLRPALARTQGFLLFTGGIAGRQPFPGFLGLDVGKAGLRTLTQVLHHDFQPDDIFVGTVTVGGTIAPGTHFDPALIADQFVATATARRDWEVDYQ